MASDTLVLLVGHCGPDSFMLRRAVKTMLGTERVEMINDQRHLLEKLPGAHLALVNRVLDGQFDTQSGIELIRMLAGIAGVRLMLVSNYADAQAEAVAVGAAPGFGKSEVNSEATRRRLVEALASVETNIDDAQSDQG